MVAQILTPGPWIELKSAAAPPAAGRWMRRHPSEIDDTVKERAGAMPRPLGETELAELRAAHERWGADDASMAAIGRLGRPPPPGLLPGPHPGGVAGPRRGG